MSLPSAFRRALRSAPLVAKRRTVWTLCPGLVFHILRAGQWDGNQRIFRGLRQRASCCLPPKLAGTRGSGHADSERGVWLGWSRRNRSCDRMQGYPASTWNMVGTLLYTSGPKYLTVLPFSWKGCSGSSLFGLQIALQMKLKVKAPNP